MEQHIKIKKTKKKEYSLNRFFIRFLARAILSFLLVTGAWGCLLYAAAAFRLVVPANAVEQAVSAWQVTLNTHTPITPRDIPEGAGYAFFDAEGRLLQTDLESTALNHAMELASSENSVNIKRSSSGVFLRIDTDTQRVIVSYQLKASFRAPLLKRLFPNAELFFLFLLLFMLLADFIFIAMRYARKLNKELQKLAIAADRIREQNLVFEPQETILTELNDIMDSLMQLKTELQRSLEEQWTMQQQKKSQFTALAHDIKTPLSIVSGNAELLAETGQSEEQKEYTAFILEHAAQIKRYVNEILALSGPDTVPSQTVKTAPSDDNTFSSDDLHCGDFPEHKKQTGSPAESASQTHESDEISCGISCEIKKLLTAAAKDVESLGKKKHLACLLRMKDLPASMPLPCDDMQRILANLADNAVQYSPENGTVYLDASLTDHTFTLCICDEGEGFSREALVLAATEFYRGDKSRGSKEHFGLGLFITGQIISRLNGTLHLENAPEKGALVRVSIPLGEKSETVL